MPSSIFRLAWPLSVTPAFGAATVYPGAAVKMPMKPSVVGADVATTR